MPFYHKMGRIPHKRHTVFRKEDGSLYQEQLFGTIGFDGMSSLMYHNYAPTIVKNFVEAVDVNPEIAFDKQLRMRSFMGYKVAPKDDYLESRVPVLTNSDVTLTLSAPKKSLRNYFYKNADCDEVLFIHEGSGKLRTQLGNIDFKYGDYLVVPRGIIYQVDFDTENNRLFVIESRRPIYTPKRYRNWFGQLLEHSPFCERDIRPPHELETHDEHGDFLVKNKERRCFVFLQLCIAPF